MSVTMAGLAPVGVKQTRVSRAARSAAPARARLGSAFTAGGRADFRGQSLSLGVAASTSRKGGSRCVTSMAAKVAGYIKLAIEAGKANPAPPIGPALGAKVRSPTEPPSHRDPTRVPRAPCRGMATAAGGALGPGVAVSPCRSNDRARAPASSRARSRAVATHLDGRGAGARLRARARHRAGTLNPASSPTTRHVAAVP